MITTSTARIAEADTKIKEQDQLLADAPRPTSSHDAKEAFRLELERTRIARRRDEARKARDEARADLEGANEAVDASFHAYWTLRVGEEAHARAVIREDYVAELLRRHPAREALEKSLEPAVDRAFTEALGKVDEAEKAVRNGQRLSGP